MLPQCEPSNAAMQDIKVRLCIFQMDLMILNEIISALASDATASSHPLSIEEEDVMMPEDIHQLFDSITYSKVQYFLSPLFYKEIVNKQYWIKCELIEIASKWLTNLQTFSEN